jgi:hypothetical protein
LTQPDVGWPQPFDFGQEVTMWLALVEGFFSVVEHKDDATKVVVRARVRDDLVALRRWVPSLGRIYALKGRDYPFRCFVSKAEFARGLATAVTEGLTYKNFKTAASARYPRRAEVLAKAWAVFRRLEEIGGLASARAPTNAGGSFGKQ